MSLILPAGMLMAILAWSLIFKWYLYPALRRMPIEQAMRPLLLLHCFRYVGLLFLVPGVTAQALDPRFAAPAAWGDLVAALLAFAALGALRFGRGAGLALVWVFNIWGTADLVNAVARGLGYTPDGALGATVWIPAVLVPVLLVTHAVIFLLLLNAAGMKRPARYPAAG